MTSPSAGRLLAIETATAWQSIALLQGERVLGLAEQDAQGSHARSLMVGIDRLLREVGLTLKDLQGFAVSIGPGSFTGLRVGLATVLGFRAVLEKPVIPVPTLESMAWNLRGAKGLVVPVLKSRHHEVYWAAYEWLPGPVLHRHVAEQVGPPASIGRVIQGTETVTLFGDGWQAYDLEIRAAIESCGAQIQDVASQLQRSSAVSVGLAARERLASGQFVESSLVPLYVQRTQAEVEFDARPGVSALERRRKRVSKKVAEGRQGVTRSDGDPGQRRKVSRDARLKGNDG